MTRGIVKITTNGFPFLIDKEDEALVESRTWYAKRDKQDKYYILDTTTKERLHRVLSNPAPKQQVDHINSIGWDNRRCNLRNVTPRDNATNRRKAKIFNNRIPTSQYKGVYIRKFGTWQASIRVHGRRYNLGSYKNEIEAALAYDEACERYNGEMGAKNFPNSAPDIARQGKLKIGRRKKGA